MSDIHGKAILVITHDDEDSWSVHGIPLTGMQPRHDRDYPNEWFDTELSMLSYQDYWPINVRKMALGETRRVKIVYHLSSYCHWDGEWDSDFSFSFVKTLRKQKPNKRRTPWLFT